MSRTMPALALAVAVAATACATTGEHQPTGNPNMLTSEQIEQSTATNAHDLVQNLRPRWLQVRGMHGAPTGQTAVYLDGARFGEIDSLRRINTRSIGSMRFLNPTEATNRFGTGHGHGAILITTR
jgi:hypothetical protein